MKKLISMLLVLTLILSIVPVASAAGMPFTDVPEKSWYTQYVQYVYDNNLMNGVSDTTFAPGAFMTRGMVVTVLYRAAGEPAVSGTHPFTDIPSGKWYEAPAIWGYQNSIVTGMTDTTFEPNRNVTREMLVALFFRYAVGSGDGISETTNLSAFEDSGQIRNYAKEAFSWAVANGIVNGKDATHLDPSGNATRAECATMLQRLFVWMGKEDGSEEPEPTKPTDPSEPSTPTEPSEPTKPTQPDESPNTATPAEQQAALNDALDYLDIFAMSYEELIDQLEYDGHSHAAAVFAADNCGANWTDQALRSALNYLDFMAFSYQGLYDQLVYEKFTADQAQYAVDNCGADWFEQALSSAKNYLEFSAFSYESLYEQLLYEDYTEAQAQYGVDNCGANWSEQAVKYAANLLKYGTFTRSELIYQLEYVGFTSEQAIYGVTQNGL